MFLLPTQTPSPTKPDPTGWPNELSVRLAFWEILGYEPMGLNPGPDDDLNIDIYNFLGKSSALLGYGKDWLAQCQDNVTE